MVIKVAIQIKPKGLRKKIDSATLKIGRVADTSLIASAKLIRNTIRRKAPSRTGALRSSIRIFKIRKGGGGLDRRANVTVGSNLVYAAVVDTGARASPGMFVPTLGVRIKKGIHPGQKAQNYLARAFNELETGGINDLFNKAYVFPLKRVLRNIGGRTV